MTVQSQSKQGQALTDFDADLSAMAAAGQKLAVYWGHQPWSDSWAQLVAETMLKVLESTKHKEGRA